ncbi:MAG: MaoC/PaaZ C-terminal domain-containing protein [Desulfuromonadales bacterium]
MRYWDDLVEGEVLDCRSIILRLEDIIEFARKFDPQQFHVDEEIAAASTFKGIIASSLHTLSATTRVIVDAQKDVEILIGLGILEVALPNAVRPDDILTVDAYWSDLRRSASKPGQGLATVRFTVRNQRRETVLESGYKYMILCRKKHAL